MLSWHTLVIPLSLSLFRSIVNLFSRLEVGPSLELCVIFFFFVNEKRVKRCVALLLENV